MHRILALNIAGQPYRWIDVQQAIYYQASEKVAWSLGEDEIVFRGGYDRSGSRSTVAVRSIIALRKSETMSKHLQEHIPLGHRNELLFKRDRHLCAYCGQRYAKEFLTREHIVPRARGGRDTWLNVVAACKACNTRKACRTPEEAGMPLLYVPYVPGRFEHFLLSGRNILADQMDYLAAGLPKGSRCL